MWIDARGRVSSPPNFYPFVCNWEFNANFADIILQKFCNSMYIKIILDTRRAGTKSAYIAMYMYTINFKSKPGSWVLGQIKVEMIFYSPGYARVPKVTNLIWRRQGVGERRKIMVSQATFALL
jgi:hypothetical protein